MQVTNGEIYEALRPLGDAPSAGALQTMLAQPWPVKTAYWLGKLARKLGEHYKDIENTRIQLVRQYGTADDKGNVRIQPGDASYEAFAKDFEDLMSEEVEIDVAKVTLPDCEIDVLPTTLLMIEPFVEMSA